MLNYIIGEARNNEWIITDFSFNWAMYENHLVDNDPRPILVVRDDDLKLRLHAYAPTSKMASLSTSSSPLKCIRSTPSASLV